MVTEATDLNSIYQEATDKIRDRVPVEAPKQEKGLSPAEKEAAAKDYYANIRTNVLLAWVLTNVSCMRRAHPVPFTDCRGCFAGTAAGHHPE